MEIPAELVRALVLLGAGCIFIGSILFATAQVLRNGEKAFGVDKLMRFLAGKQD